MMTRVMTHVTIDLWVLLAGVALPSACLLMISLVYCWRRLTRRHRSAAVLQTGDPGFNQQILLEMVLQQTDNAFNSIVDAVQEQRIQMLKLLETHQLSMPVAAGPDLQSAEIPAGDISAANHKTAGKNSTLNNSAAASSLKNNSPGKNTLFDPYSQIPDYIQQGLTSAEVAACLDLPEAAVDLYVNLRMSATKDGSQKTA
jgi:hypothetical protein